MQSQEPLIRNISDTARWAAVYRARESRRPDALFNDPFAARLAGDRGEEIARMFQFTDKHAWTWVMRTHLFDQHVLNLVRAGADTVINLAAGLDARPYRMNLPASLRWVEVDLPEILAYKEDLLKSERPACALERVRLDLADESGRRAIFERIGQNSKNAVVVSEGILIYLDEAEVASLARDLAAQAPFQHWVIDLASPGLLKIMTRNMGSTLDKAGVPFKFGPASGANFFSPHGWNPVEVRGLLKVAASFGRLPWFLRLISLLPDSPGPGGRRPWGGVGLLARQ